MTHDWSLESSICRWLSAHSFTLATAESCSGGLIAHRMTNVPGASAVFRGGVVAYGNEVKESLLGVNPSVLRDCGAVSESVARQMAEGARRLFAADYGVGVTGIAGPSDGTAEKPVGLAFVAVAASKGTVVRRHVFSGTREDIKNQTADMAFVLLKEVLS